MRSLPSSHNSMLDAQMRMPPQCGGREIAAEFSATIVPYRHSMTRPVLLRVPGSAGPAFREIRSADFGRFPRRRVGCPRRAMQNRHRFPLPVIVPQYRRCGFAVPCCPSGTKHRRWNFAQLRGIFVTRNWCTSRRSRGLPRRTCIAQPGQMACHRDPRLPMSWNSDCVEPFRLSRPPARRRPNALGPREVSRGDGQRESYWALFTPVSMCICKSPRAATTARENIKPLPGVHLRR